jgi:hypothetical protein
VEQILSALYPLWDYSGLYCYCDDNEETCMKGEDVCEVQTVHWTCNQGCAMAQVVSRQSLTTEAFVHAWVGFVVGKV